MTVVCITGMHRSGTSMVARMLNLCGIYLGGKEDLLNKADDNPEGYWEHRQFVELNDNILWHLKGGWDIPPSVHEINNVSQIPLEYRTQAVNLINEMDHHAPWGWKDPRNSLTLPFWQELLPDVKIVLCVRNPVDVALSMANRGFSSFPFSGNLWKIYYERVLAAASAENLIVTHYDSFFTEPETELNRLLSFLKIAVEEQTLNQAVDALKTGLRHNKSVPENLLNFPYSHEIIELYVQLCTQASIEFTPPLTSLLSNNQTPSSKENGVQNSIQENNDLINLRQAKVIKSLSEHLAVMENSIQELNIQITHKDQELETNKINSQVLTQQLQDSKNYIAQIEQSLRTTESERQQANSDLQQTNNELQQIKTGVTWKIYELIVRIRLLLIPPASRREQIAHYLIRSGRILKVEGIRNFIQRANNKIKTLLRKSNAFLPIHTADKTTHQQIIHNKDEFVPITDKDATLDELLVKLIAFYLPQFHPIPENDEWWGKGFTEWVNVTKATPNFDGHYQPHLPGELGFYDLRIPEVMEQQIALAKKYGIYGFCFYYYWFAGKRLLERPINQFLANTHLDLPFCLCWANENWTRRWDGAENDVLIAQEYTSEQYLHFIQDISKHFSDPRYIRVDGKPMLLVYRVNLLPDPQKAVDVWRKECRETGIGEIYLVAVQSFGITDPRPFGFDAAVEFPPSYLGMAEINQKSVKITNPKFNGRLFDYKLAMQAMLEKQQGDYTYFKTVMPSWDNTARKQNDSHIFVNSSPVTYKTWLEKTVTLTRKILPEEKRFVFVNAWNEWAEGTHLEPDKKYGYAYLQATADAITKAGHPASWTLLFISHDANKGGAQEFLINTIAWLKTHTNIRIKVLCLQGGPWLYRFEEFADTLVLHKQFSFDQFDSLLEKVQAFCEGTPDLIYGNTVAAGHAYTWLEKMGVPIVTHFHELESSIRKYGEPWLKEIKEFSSHYIACSKAVRDNLINAHTIDSEKISTVYATITSKQDFIPTGSQKVATRKRLGLDTDKILIFGCGIGMPFRKGADLFIETGMRLLQKGQTEFHLYWIGDFDSEYTDENFGTWKKHQTRLRNRQVEKHITFLGVQDNPREYLSCGDIFLLPSREDPFPLVALEAADCGLPIVCFDKSGGMPDFVAQDAGIIVPFENVNAVADCLIELINDKKERQDLGRNARAKFLSGFTTDQSAPQILSICRKIANKKPAISVIVPNYNHEEYLEQRLESIFNQTFKDFEVILLDDASTDESLDILNQYTHRTDVRIVPNESNSGSPFKQWLRGIDMANSDLLWIAESDDDCEPDFLKTLLPAFANPRVKLAYANSHIMNESSKIIGDYNETDYLSSLSKTKWSKDYQTTAEQEINDGLGIKNTILNISAVVMRKFEISRDFRSTLDNMHIAGDWYFVVNAIKDGNINYTSRKLNLHRRHTKSVIAQTVNDGRLNDFLNEFLTVQEFIIATYKLSKEFPGVWESYLKIQWNDFTNGRDFNEIEMYYPFNRMKQALNENVTDYHA